MLQGRALLADLEISQIKEETNSKEGASQLTRNKSNFLGSAASPYGDDRHFQQFLHRQSHQSKAGGHQGADLSNSVEEKEEDEPNFSDLFQAKDDQASSR